MPGSPTQRLDSWKAVAAFLGRDVSTVRRWEKETGLPVHRVAGNKRHAVYAYTDELDLWLRQAAPAAPPTVDTIRSAPASPNTRSHRTLLIVVGLIVATALTGFIALASERWRPLARRLHAPTFDQTVREAYTRGRYHFNTRTADGLRTAIEYFKQATEMDSRYAPAYAGLADSYTLLGLAGGGISAADVAPQASAAALKAIELDGALAEAHNSLAAVKSFYEWDWTTAEREFKRALELDPNYAPAHHWYGIVYLAAQGRQAESIAEMRRAVELDPGSAIYATDLGWALYLEGHYDEAINQYQAVLERHPNFGVTLFRLGEAREQKGIYNQVVPADLDPFPRPTAVMKEWTPGTSSAYRHQLEENIEAFIKISRTARVAPYFFASGYGRLGDADHAMTWLEKAYAEHEPALIYLGVDPIFGGLHADKRFQRLVRRIGVGPRY